MAMHATALFADRHSAHAALEQLAQAGFARDVISVAMSEETHAREFPRGSVGPWNLRRRAHAGRIAGILGAIVAALATIATPGEPALRAGGPLVAAILRAGTLPAALVSVGMAESEANALRDGLHHGSIAVGVHAIGDRAGLAKRLLELSGGVALQAA